MPRTSPVNRRYATAIVEACAAEGDAAVDAVARELASFVAAVRASADLENLLANPGFTALDRERTLDAMSARLGLSPRTRRFLGLLAQRHRLGEIDQVADAVQKLADDRGGRMRVQVDTAAPLTPDAQEALTKAMEHRTGKRVDLDVVVDPTLLGGLRARVGSLVLDGTLRSQLEALRERLTHAE